MNKGSHNLLRIALAALSLLLLTGSGTFAQSFDGFALYNSLNSSTAYLVDKDGNIAHTWSCTRPCNYAALLKPNGNLIRGAINQGNQINGAAVGGLLQEYDPSGNVIWEFTYSSSTVVAHHDIAMLPNGNVLMIAWEVKSSTELQNAGFTGTGNQKYVTHFIEVAQNGNGGQIVWEWHMWDHMVQDADQSKPNYGQVSANPQLLNINVTTSGGGGGPGGGADWFHCNGIDYNDSLDQIVFSSRYLSEIFIIDHSTSTAEAAGHTGGNSGKGGDFLYRYGNPNNYGVAFGTRNIDGPCHDPRWIPNDGRANGGYIQFFNNDGVSGGNSEVNAIELPHNGFNYNITANSGYDPQSPTWTHNCLSNASGQSASDRLPNGNTFVNLSGGYMYEVDSLNNTVWQYAAGPAKAFRYTCDYAGITALLGANPCGGVAIDDSELAEIQLYPNPSTGVFRLAGIDMPLHEVNITVYDAFGSQIQQLNNVQLIDLSAHAHGVYFVKINVDGVQTTAKKVNLIR